MRDINGPHVIQQRQDFIMSLYFVHGYHLIFSSSDYLVTIYDLF
ncbi:hypothetical protein VAEKB19_5200006 [Vibrio aestuarianus]|nr:hypothetical protein VAEKB19_5200006 [Vibrio aestuarianus]